MCCININSGVRSGENEALFSGIRLNNNIFIVHLKRTHSASPLSRQTGEFIMEGKNRVFSKNHSEPISKQYYANVGPPLPTARSPRR
jgi:hypothetical protein